MIKIKDRLLGCMIGGAAGDALGYTVEFDSYSRIIKEYGPVGITRYRLSDNDLALISDDTQMSIYTANGLIIGDIQTAYLEWLATQGWTNDSISNPKCWVSDIPEMYALRAPGNTCLSALRAVAKGVTAVNDSKGCGGIMRVAPIGLWGATHHINIYETVECANQAAKITHKHALGWLPAGILAYTIQRIIDDDVNTKEEFLSVVDSLSSVYDRYDKVIPSEDLAILRQGTLKAITLAESDLDDNRAINQLGEGWTGEEAWFIALYSTIKHFGNFEKALIASVNHDGDSDSTGAITGNLMGTIHGYSAIPDHFIKNLELKDVIEKISVQLI